MCKVDWNTKRFPFKPGFLSLAWINKNESDDNWTLLYQPSGCRTYMSCWWWLSQVNKDYLKHTNTIPYIKDKLTPPAKEYTGIFFTNGPEGSYNTVNIKDFEERVRSNLPVLNEIEEKYGLTPTTIVVADDPTGITGIIFVGDPAWHSTLWKGTVYTYLLKRLCMALTPKRFFPRSLNEDDYWKYLKKNNNFEKLMSKVKDFNEEVVKQGTFDYIHAFSGFQSIIISDDMIREGGSEYHMPNLAMAKLLLGKEKK